MDSRDNPQTSGPSLESGDFYFARSGENCSGSDTMGPLPAADGHDGPGLVDEPVPGVAAERHDVIVGLEDAVGEPVVA